MIRSKTTMPLYNIYAILIYTNILSIYNCYTILQIIMMFIVCDCIGWTDNGVEIAPLRRPDPRHAEIPFRAAAPLLWPVLTAVVRTMGLLMKIATERQMRTAGKVSVQTNYILLCRICSYTHTHTHRYYLYKFICVWVYNILEKGEEKIIISTLFT